MNPLLITILILTLKAGIDVRDAWVRPGAKGMNTAMYCEIKNNQDVSDTLYAVKSDLAQVTEIHETYKKGPDMMGMRKAGFVVIKPHSSFFLKPGAHHIMLISLKKPLKSGDKQSILLRFKKAGDIKLTAIVKI